MEQKILLCTNRLNQKFFQLEQDMTRIRDSLDFLRQEEETLAGIWQGEAKLAWEQEFQRRLSLAQEMVKKGTDSLALLKEQAGMLALEERKIMDKVDALRV